MGQHVNVEHRQPARPQPRDDNWVGSSDWTYAEAELKRRLGRNFLIYASSVNSHTKTFAGVDGAGKRLADEVSSVNSHTKALMSPVTICSFKMLVNKIKSQLNREGNIKNSTLLVFPGHHQEDDEEAANDTSLLEEEEADMFLLLISGSGIYILCGMSESKRGYDDHDSDDEGISRVDLMKYEAEVEASGGYDVGEYVSNLCGMIHPITVNRWEDLPSYAEMAVHHYNQHNHTKFKVVEILKANIGVVSGFMFYITFKAEDSNTGKTETFQSRVWSKIPGPNGEDRVEIIQFDSADEAFEQHASFVFVFSKLYFSLREKQSACQRLLKFQAFASFCLLKGESDWSFLRIKFPGDGRSLGSSRHQWKWPMKNLREFGMLLGCSSAHSNEDIAGEEAIGFEVKKAIFFS
ncbi:hypothetical protein GQ457_08G022160 [Hibiscus cannabinus]